MREPPDILADTRLFEGGFVGPSLRQRCYRRPTYFLAPFYCLFLAFFVRANSESPYFRLSPIMKITKNAIFGAKKAGVAPGYPHSRPEKCPRAAAEWKRKVSGESSNNPSRVVELLGANPFIAIKGATDKLAIAFTTAQRAIERLERARIVKRMGDAKRDRVYCATALLDILEEPARLKPADNK